MNTLKERLEWARNHKHPRPSIQDIATACGITRGAVSLWFAGTTKALSAENYREAADFFGISSYWLETGEGEPLAGTLLANDQDIHKVLNLMMRMDKTDRAKVAEIAQVISGDRKPIAPFTEKRRTVTGKLPAGMKERRRAIETNIFAGDPPEQKG